MRLPDNFKKYHLDIMSNFDHKIEKDVEKEIKNKSLFSAYPGWNFSGKVWWQKKEWHCEVWTYHNYQETISSKTLEEIMEKVSKQYGSD